MATISKTAGISLLSLQSIASNTVAITSGGSVDVSTKLAGTVLIHFGRRTTSALSAPATFRVEVSAKSSGDGFWFPGPVFQTGLYATAAESEAVSGTVSSGTNVITVASTTNLVVGNTIYLDNGTIANSEWGRIKSVSTNTSVTIEDNLLNAQTSSTIYNQGEMFLAFVDLSSWTRIRLVADCSGTGQAVAVEAFLVTGDAIS